MSRHRALLPIAGAAITAFVLLGAGDPSIDPSKSTLIATLKQENVPVDASFKSFSGQIQYDGAQPSAARAMIQVQTGSFDMGSANYNAEVAKRSWLDSTSYPTASFVSTSIRPAGSGKFDATGTLTLKGKTQTLTVPVTVGKLGTAMTFDGVFAISRKFFGIGAPDWNDVVDDQVRVRFHLVE
jgi:polyisoprenoid-binding protein YceI